MFRRPTTTTFALVGSLALTLTSLAAPTSADTTQAQPDQEPAATAARVAGEDRHETAAEVARLSHAEAEHALLSTGDAFADALAGAALAGLDDAPVLLTTPDELHEEAASALQDLDVQQVTIVGGPSAVGASVEAELRADGYDVTRISGTSRYGTAAALARYVQARRDNGANFPGGQRAVFLANGERFPDAVAAGPLSASSPSPIPMLLTPEDELHPETRQALVDLQVELVVIAGGENAVSNAVEDEIAALGINVDRVAGADRSETAVALAEFAREYLDFDFDQFVLASGNDFPDALAAGPYAGERNTPVLLTQSADALGASTESRLLETCDTVDVVRAVGGRDAISAATLDDAVEAADDCATD